MTGGNYVISIDEFERKFPKPIRADPSRARAFLSKTNEPFMFYSIRGQGSFEDAFKSSYTHMISCDFIDTLNIRTNEKLENISRSQRIGV